MNYPSKDKHPALNCALCGGEGQLFCDHDSPGSLGDTYAVKCEDCNNTGLYRVMPDAAVEVWNDAQRTQLEKQGSEAVHGQTPKTASPPPVCHTCKPPTRPPARAVQGPSTFRGITCPKCGRASYNPKDALHQYCPFCRMRHAEMGPQKPLKT